MNCQDFQNQFSDFADQELDAQAVVLFERHLLSCQQCRMEWLFFQKTVNSLHAMHYTPPPDLLAGIERKLDFKNSLAELFSAWWATVCGANLPLKAAGVLVTVLLAVILLRSEDQNSQKTTVKNSSPPINNSRQNIFSPERFAMSDSNGGRTVQFVSTNTSQRPLPFFNSLSSLPRTVQQKESYSSADLLYTIQGNGQTVQADLLARLAADRRWQVQQVRDDLLLIRLRGDDLGSLQAILENRGTWAFLEQGGNPLPDMPEQDLVVALRFF